MNTRIITAWMDINELVHHFRYKVNKITLKIIIIIVAWKTNYIKLHRKL